MDQVIGLPFWLFPVFEGFWDKRVFEMVFQCAYSLVLEEYWTSLAVEAVSDERRWEV